MTDAPTSAPRAVAPFSHLAGDHPLAPAVERFTAAIRAHERHAEHAAALAAGRATVHTDLTLRPGADGASTIHRAYWSLQSTGPDGFAATTLAYHATRDRATWIEFPDDPELPAMARLGTGPGPVEVLRYMPLRRCTVRSELVRRRRTPMIVKFKRPHRLADSWRLLKAVWAALGDGHAGFDVAAPLGSDPPRGHAGQTALEGDDLATLVGPDRRLDLLCTAGALHRAMHAADVPGVGPEDPDAQLAELRADATWVATALPASAAHVRAIERALEAHAPPPADPAFCHGDLVPSQLLVAGDRWAITDFDGARHGDPHRDVAVWLAALAYDVPALRDAIERCDDAPVARAEAAYLDGYGPVDERRLAWHRAAAEVHALAVALKKDRHHPARSARGLATAGASAAALDR